MFYYYKGIESSLLECKQSYKMAKNHDVGRKSEDFAAKYLTVNGYEILNRNWRFSKAEIDLVARHDEVLIFIEVKSRSSLHFGRPEHSITKRKEHLIIDAANEYMRQKNHTWEIRFDIISIYWKTSNHPRLTHFKDAFF